MRYHFHPGDTTKAWRSIPLFQYDTFDEFYANLPHGCQLNGVEFPHDKAKALPEFTHSNQCIYLLVAEDHGLSRRALERCHQFVYIPSQFCLNVSVAGSIIMYDRMLTSKLAA